MIPNLLKHIPITTLIVSYFFICGGLYIIGFWQIFDVDISNFVSLADIPKSFIFPFVYSQGFFVLFMFFNIFFADNDRDLESAREFNFTFLKYRIVKFILSPKIIFLCSLAVIMNLHEKYNLYPEFWLIASTILSCLLSSHFLSIKKIKELIPFEDVREYLVATIVSIPFISFACGKSNGLKIYNNSEIKYVHYYKDLNSNATVDSTKKKLLGFLGDKIIVSSLDNKVVIFINQSSVEKIQLRTTP